MRILILGGGISGLAAGFFARRAHPNAHIILLEATNRLGGWMETSLINGFSFELGPRTFQRARSNALFHLIADLGLSQDIVYSDPAAEKRYLWVKGKLRTPISFWPRLLLAAIRDLTAPRQNFADETIYDFACRRFGKFAAEIFFDPLAKGIFAGDIRKLSLSACFPAFIEWERTHRSIVRALFSRKRGLPGLFTLRGGMQTLIDTLAKFPNEIHTQTPVEAIHPHGVTAAGHFWPADLIVSALPGNVASALCEINLSFRMESLSVVCLGYTQNILPKRGFGYLVPTCENEKLLGQIWDSCVFPSSNQTKITAMVRGENPQEIALETIRRHLGVKSFPDAIAIRHAVIPQYELYHQEKVAHFQQQAAKKFPKLRLLGNFLEGASVEACIQRAIKIFSIN